MKRFILLPILLPILLLCVQSCNDDPVCGCRCAYDTISGTALIKSIVPDTLDNRICSNAVIVYFDFIPDDPGAPGSYRFPNHPDTSRTLFIADGKNPPSTWIEAEGLGVGTEHECVRLEETRGTCTPVLFVFLNLDYTGWMEYCDPLE
jgi:hypothetical protein